MSRDYGGKIFNPLVQLPDEIAVVVGQMTALYSYIEFLVKNSVRTLAGIDPKIGRVVIRSPHPPELIDMIEEICEVRQVKLKTNLTLLRGQLQVAKQNRDLYAHTTWLVHPKTGRPCIRRIRGKWPKGHEIEGVTFAIMPKVEQVTLLSLRKRMVEIEAARSTAESLDKEVSKLPRV